MNIVQNCVKIIVAGFALTLIACQSKPDFEALRSGILELHKTTIDAHWKKDIDFFTKDIADNYFSVGNGEIRKPTRAEINQQFTDYLSNTTFTEYRDLEEPIIGFSKDGSLAWSIVKVKIAGRRATNNGTEHEMDFTCAWITLYERENDKWIRLGEVSSFK